MEAVRERVNQEQSWLSKSMGYLLIGILVVILRSVLLEVVRFEIEYTMVEFSLGVYSKPPHILLFRMLLI